MTELVVLIISFGGFGCSPIIVATVLDRVNARRGRQSGLRDRLQRWLGA